MYEIYTTQALVLSARTQGESDHYVRFYTKELGLVGARVSGSRKEISKHRFSIQPYSFVSVSLVKGKQGFRMTGIEHERHLVLGKQNISKKSVSSVISLIELLVHGQEKDENLFHLLSQLLVPEMLTDELDEIYIVVRLLKHLGYFDEQFLETIPETMFDQIMPDERDLSHIKENKHTYIQYINECIHNSQL